MYYSENIQKLMEKTNGGADIIISIYPQAEACLGTKKLFKIRPEKEASVSWYQYKDSGNFGITDFGGNNDSKCHDAIRVAMDAWGMDRYSVVNRLLQMYGISTGKGSEQQIIKKYSLGENDKPGDISFQPIPFDKNDLRYFGPEVTEQNLTDLNWIRVENLRQVYKDFVIEKTAYDVYPIYIRKCTYVEDGQTKFFYKIYEPMNRDKGYRFRYSGDKPRHYIHGLHEAKLVHEQEVKNGVDPKKFTPLVICCGERDAAVVKSFGHLPIWFNSETDFPESDEEMKPLLDLERKIYFVPDIDATGIEKGKELALRFPWLKTLWLPESLKENKDWRGNPKKDLRDWAQLPGNDRNTFRKMLCAAMPAQYFDRDDKKGKLRINEAWLHYYLWLNDFGGYRFVEGDRTRLALISKDVCVFSEVNQSSVVEKFLKDSLPLDDDWNEKYNLIGKYGKSDLSMAKLASLKPLPYSVIKATKHVEHVIFQNTVVEITADGFKTILPKNFGGMVHESVLIKHNLIMPKELPVTIDLSDPKTPNVSINNYNSYMLRLVINMSRVYWNEEYVAYSNDGHSLEEFYCDTNGRIISPYLSDEQNEVQWKCLMTMMFAIGSVIAEYKKRNETWSVYVLDLNGKPGESNGRTGKGTLFQLVDEMAPAVVFDGRKNLTDYTHAFDRVTPETRRLRIDDYDPQKNSFDSLYNQISDTMVVNPKNKPQFSLSFDKSPKVVFTSNQILPKSDASTEGRVLYVPVSDWYHKAAKSNEYLNSHQPADDFGIMLGQDYSDNDWNNDFAFMLCCVQLYMIFSKNNLVIKAPEELLVPRRLATQFPKEFGEWMDEYMEDKFGTTIVKDELFDDYYSNIKDKPTPTKLKKWFEAWVEYKGYDLNKGMPLSKDGRYLKYVSKYNQTKECFVITKRDS